MPGPVLRVPGATPATQPGAVLLDLTFADTGTDVLRRVRILASLDLGGNSQIQRSVVPTVALVARMASWLVAPPAELATSVTAAAAVRAPPDVVDRHQHPLEYRRLTSPKV